MVLISKRFGWARKTVCLLVSSAVSTMAVLAESKIEITKLPPPATASVDFAKDIKPLLENTCLKCHGPQQPSGQFRLDTREGLFKGGQNGVNIIPGDSAKSSLIHFVARLVDGMEMPPKGVGDPLTREQIGLLRGWIDQGATWPDGV